MILSLSTDFYYQEVVWGLKCPETADFNKTKIIGKCEVMCVRCIVRSSHSAQRFTWKLRPPVTLS
jgi:hypothetical protein